MTFLRRRRLAAIALLAATFMLAAVPSARAQTFPALSGRVVDEAGVLDPSVRQHLTTQLAALEQKTSDQVVVATVRSLQGYSVEDYANRLFRAWRLGQSTTNNGVLLLVARSDHKVRIEVGYGLEGTLPDAVAKLIIEELMVSRLRANQFDAAIESAVTSIVDVLTGSAAEWKQRAAVRPHYQANSHPAPVGNILFTLVFGVLFLGGFAGVAFVALHAVINGLIAIHVLPQFKARRGWWHWLDFFDDGKPPPRRRASSQQASSYPSSYAWASSSSSSWSDSSSSSSSDSFSGGGGSSGGGGASGSW